MFYCTCFMWSCVYHNHKFCRMHAVSQHYEWCSHTDRCMYKKKGKLQLYHQCAHSFKGTSTCWDTLMIREITVVHFWSWQLVTRTTCNITSQHEFTFKFSVSFLIFTISLINTCSKTIILYRWTLSVRDAFQRNKITTVCVVHSFMSVNEQVVEN